MNKKNEIIEEIQRIAVKLGRKSVKKTEFSRNSKIGISTVRYHFGSWNKAVEAAGLVPIDPLEMIRKKEIIPDKELLMDLMRLYHEFHREPTASLINSNGKFSEIPYKRRWKSIHEAFLIAQNKYGNESTFTTSNEEPSTTGEKVIIIPETIKPKTSSKRKIVFGEPIDFRGLRFAPINEQGVVYLFGMISQELGYLIESIRTEYPDCEGKRCFDKAKNKWEHVQIEFEFKSSHFKDHGHNEELCDIIVCWEHDWQECPVEVLELRNVIKCL